MSLAAHLVVDHADAEACGRQYSHHSECEFQERGLQQLVAPSSGARQLVAGVRSILQRDRLQNRRVILGDIKSGGVLRPTVSQQSVRQRADSVRANSESERQQSMREPCLALTAALFGCLRAVRF